MTRTSIAQAMRKLDQSRRYREITPPEGVPVRFQIGTLAARAGAQIADLLISVMGTLAIIILVALTPLRVAGILDSLFAILFLAIRAPYYIFSELFWNGQTIGKKMMGIRVLQVDGTGLSTHAVIARNLMKEAEVFVPASMLVAAPEMSVFWQTIIMVWIITVLIVPLTNSNRQRIGDILANTYVIVYPKPYLLPDLSDIKEDAGFVFTPAQLDIYGRFELQTLEELLRSEDGHSVLDEIYVKNIDKVARTVHAKIEYPGTLQEQDAMAFLKAFYKAQRAHLENRQMFGEVRDDKFHGSSVKGSPKESS